MPIPRAVALLALALCAPLACSGDDEPSVERRLVDELEAQVGVEGVDVSCPEDAEPARGARFDCRVSKGGETATVRVTYDTDEHFTFDLAEGEPVPGFILDAVDEQLPPTSTTSTTVVGASG